MTSGTAGTGSPLGRLLGGTAMVGVGLGAAGAGTIAMFAIAARSLPAGAYAAFAVWWTVATLLGITFGVFEAYLARLVVTEVAAGREPRSVIGELAGRAALTALGLSVTCAGSPSRWPAPSSPTA